MRVHFWAPWVGVMMLKPLLEKLSRDYKPLFLLVEMHTDDFTESGVMLEHNRYYRDKNVRRGA